MNFQELSVQINAVDMALTLLTQVCVAVILTGWVPIVLLRYAQWTAALMVFVLVEHVAARKGGLGWHVTNVFVILAVLNMEHAKMENVNAERAGMGSTAPLMAALICAMAMGDAHSVRTAGSVSARPAGEGLDAMLPWKLHVLITRIMREMDLWTVWTQTVASKQLVSQVYFAVDRVILLISSSKASQAHQQ